MASPLPDKDFRQIVKMLGMTGSEHDAEAVSHLRKVHAILQRHQTTMAELLEGKNSDQTDVMFVEARRAARAAQAEVKRQAAEILALQAEIAKRKSAFDRMVAQHRKAIDKANADLQRIEEQRDALLSRIAALTPEPDPWTAILDAFLKGDPDCKRVTSAFLLDALGVPGSERTTDVYRRLSYAMQAVGGWRASTNVVDDDGYRARGYIRISPFYRK